MFDHLQERGVVTGHVQEHDRLLMISQQLADEDLEYFLESSQPARQCDKCISAGFKQRLALSHARGDDQLAAMVIGNPGANEKFRGDADPLPAGGPSRIRQRAHAPDVVQSSTLAPAVAVVAKTVGRILNCASYVRVR